MTPFQRQASEAQLKTLKTPSPGRFEGSGLQGCKTNSSIVLPPTPERPRVLLAMAVPSEAFGALFKTVGTTESDCVFLRPEGPMSFLPRIRASGSGPSS